MLFAMSYDEQTRRNVVSEAEPYQIRGLETFIKSLPHTATHEHDNTKQYIYDGDNISMDDYTPSCSSAVIFSINTFNYKRLSLNGVYDDFYELNNHNGKTYIISKNEDKLKGFCGWINRLTQI